MSDHVQGGRLRRFVQLATVTARTTSDLLASEARRRLTRQDTDDIERALEPTAARLVKVLGELKGAATKLGQFVSLVDQDTFPEEARRVLSRLLSQTPHRMSYEQAGEVIAAELGAPPEELFASFSAEPFAAASMGQVHAATLHDGREVVVKVQFPGVEKAIESDLRNIGVLARGLSFTGALLDGRAYLDEIADTLRRELDYEEEVRQLEAYREAARPWPGLVIPDAIPERSAKRVVTLERLHGPTVLEAAHDEDTSPERRFLLARRLCEAIWGPFLREGLVHADPHPGNYIALPDGRLGVLDFGATKRLSLEFTLAYWRIVVSALRREPRELSSLLAGAGFEIHGDPDKVEAWLQELAAIVERPIRDGTYDWADCRISADCRDHAARNVATVLRCRAPREGVMFYRAAAGLAGDFRLLRAEGDFRAVLCELAAVARDHLAPELARAGGELFDALPVGDAPAPAP